MVKHRTYIVERGRFQWVVLIEYAVGLSRVWRSLNLPLAEFDVLFDRVVHRSRRPFPQVDHEIRDCVLLVAMQRRELHNKKGKMDDSINVGFFTSLCNQLHDCMGEIGRWVAWLWMQLWMIPRESHGLEKKTALPAMTLWLWLRLKGLFNYACKYARAFRKLVRKTRPFARFVKFWVDISTTCSSR